MNQSSKDNNQKFSNLQKLTIAILIFTAILILGFLSMLLTGRMVIPL